MTEIPGSKAEHTIITDACREGKGDEQALHEAIGRLTKAYIRACGGWKAGMGANIHLAMTVEPPG